MAGTATDFDVTKIHQGPGNLWIIGGGVADGATPQLTLAADGTPDSAAHPASVHLGATDSAIALTMKPKFDDIMVDQFSGAVDRYLQNEQMALEVELAQLNPAIIQQAASFGVYTSAAGYKQITFGGLTTLVTPCIACIAPKRAVAGKYLVAILFKAHGLDGFAASIGRAKKAMFKAKFDALTDMTRTAGRQLGVFYETL